MIAPYAPAPMATMKSLLNKGLAKRVQITLTTEEDALVAQMAKLKGVSKAFFIRDAAVGYASRYRGDK